MKFVFLLLITLVSCSHLPKSQPQTYVADTVFRPKVEKATFFGESPVVCFDESNHNLAVEAGNYQAMLGLLESDGYKIVHIKNEYSKETLEGCKILYASAVLGHPNYHNKKLSSQSAFNEDEIKAITTWVKAGGSLLVTTDHKPMSNSAAKLLEAFGVHGSKNSVRNEKKLIPPFTDPGIFSIKENQMNLKSPIVRGRNAQEKLKDIYFFYGEALNGPENSDIFLQVGKDAKIGGIEDIPEIPIHLYPAAALAIKFNKGRVVVIGDGTVFTSKYDLKLSEKTGINRSGSDNIQMALNVFHWLSGILN